MKLTKEEEVMMNNKKSKTMEKLRLIRDDFKVYIVEGDGNCGPRVLSIALFGTQDNHMTVRT